MRARSALARARLRHDVRRRRLVDEPGAAPLVLVAMALARPVRQRTYLVGAQMLGGLTRSRTTPHATPPTCRQVGSEDPVPVGVPSVSPLQFATAGVMRQLAKTVVRLNVETKHFHGQADAPWLDLIGRADGISRLDYIHHLIRVYGFDAPLEAALAYTPHIGGFFDLHHYSRAGLIAQDLLVLGMKPAEISALRQCMIAPFASVADACGWLYVHQRRTLQHEALRSRLETSSPDLAPAMSYLRSHEGHIGGDWDNFGRALDRVARTPHIENHITAAANDAFHVATEWFGQDVSTVARKTSRGQQSW